MSVERNQARTSNIQVRPMATNSFKYVANLKETRMVKIKLWRITLPGIAIGLKLANSSIIRV